jgi:hypothetical protein
MPSNSNSTNTITIMDFLSEPPPSRTRAGNKRTREPSRSSSSDSGSGGLTDDDGSDGTLDLETPPRRGEQTGSVLYLPRDSWRGAGLPKAIHLQAGEYRIKFQSQDPDPKFWFAPKKQRDSASTGSALKPKQTSNHRNGRSITSRLKYLHCRLVGPRALKVTGSELV